MSAFCTSRDHAIKVARYFISLRRRITHSVSFKTVPEGAGIRPGDLIKVAIEKSQLNSFNNGIINTDGSVVCATPLANGTYAIVYFKSGMEDVMSASLVIRNGVTTQSALFGSMFTLAATSISTNTYQIEQVELDEDGLVNVLATEYPVEQMLVDLSGSNTVTSED
jgi:predicted phage tail protein